MPERPSFPFIVGCGRSGTTLVRALLNAHPDFAVPFESYFPVWFARRRGRYERSGRFDTARFLADLFAHQSFRRWALDDQALRNELEAARPRDFSDAIRATFAAYAHAHGKPRYADKTPAFVTHIPTLAALFPEAVFVHVIRDGRDVVLSRAQAAWGTHRLDHEALLWRTQVEQGRRDGRALGARRYFELRYEDLVDDAAVVAQRLCSFVGADFDPSMLQYYEHADRVLGDQPFPEEHANLRRPPSKLRDFRKELSARDLALVERLERPALDALGYERAARPLGPIVALRALWARAAYAVRGRYKASRRVIWEATHREHSIGSRR